ncbi:RnfH family protein [Buchnera aphidicola (Mindarus keteleerifoliae)]|uniref:RnfH family protein n=1 Tax=Buchnera aphidicola TaxID=9 RepID=UPI0031B6C674
MKKINVSLVYAYLEIQYILKIRILKHSTVKEVILKSKILNFSNDINLSKNKIGIYGKIVSLNDFVEEGDRIEIYRNLFFTPQELRIKNLKKIK